MAADSRPALGRGQIFHGLLVHSALGEGAMGAAYLASHPILQVPLVIKIFKSAADANIFKEAHLAARVHSPNIVGVLDAGIESGMAFVVQRYVDGIDLSELIGRARETGWRLPVNIVCRILIDAARGLHCIHQAGIVHRDVKPANLFLCGNGDTTVGDFGIALDAVREGSEEMVVGTPPFMAPEQWERKPVDRRTDIYALGATGHLLATGQLPFAAHDMAELVMAHLKQPYVAPSAAEPGAAYLFAVIERMLRKQVEERYPTAEAVARVLDVIAEPLPPLVCTTPHEARIGALRVALEVGDLSESAGDVIVNAANAVLAMGVGVARALRLAGGDGIQQEAMSHAPVAMGEVVWTTAGKLRAQWVAHAVAASNGAICLQRAALRVLLGAEARYAQSVVFPALGTGVGEVPIYLAAKLMLEAMQTFAALRPRYARQIRVVLRDEVALAHWRTILQSMSPEVESGSVFTHATQVPISSSPLAEPPTFGSSFDEPEQVTTPASVVEPLPTDDASSFDEQTQAIPAASRDEQTMAIPVASTEGETEAIPAAFYDEQTMAIPAAVPEDQTLLIPAAATDDGDSMTVSTPKAQSQSTTAMLNDPRQSTTAMLKAQPQAATGMLNEQQPSGTAPLDHATLGADVVLPDTTSRFQPFLPPVVRTCPLCETEYSEGERFCVRDGNPLEGGQADEEY